VKKWEEELKRWENMPAVKFMTRGEEVEYLPDLLIDFRKQPSLFPHTEAENDPAKLAQTKGYYIHFPEDH